MAIVNSSLLVYQRVLGNDEKLKCSVEVVFDLWFF